MSFGAGLTGWRTPWLCFFVLQRHWAAREAARQPANTNQGKQPANQPANKQASQRNSHRVWQLCKTRSLSLNQIGDARETTAPVRPHEAASQQLQAANRKSEWGSFRRCSWAALRFEVFAKMESIVSMEMLQTAWGNYVVYLTHNQKPHGSQWAFVTAIARSQALLESDWRGNTKQ